MHFNFYLACRMSVPGWVFNESDIRTMTGIHRRMVSAHCRALVHAGIFAKCGITENGSSQYKLDNRKFDAYLKGTKPLDPVEKPIKPEVSMLPPLSSDDSPPYHPMIAPLSSDDSPPLSSNDSPPYHPVTPNKEDNKEELKKEEEKEDTHSRGVGECFQLFSDETKQDNSGKEVRETQVTHRTVQSSNGLSADIQAAIVSGFPFAVNCSASTVTRGPLLPATPLPNPTKDEIGAKMSQAIVPLVQDPAEEYRQYKIDQAQKEEQKRRFKQEQQERADRAETIWVANIIASPLKEKESISNLAPDEKVQVLKAGIETMNQNGDFDYASGRSYHHQVIVTRKSLETARQFFTDNPNSSRLRYSQHVGECGFVHHHNEEPKNGEYCKHFYAWKAGGLIGLFLEQPRQRSHLLPGQLDWL